MRSKWMYRRIQLLNTTVAVFFAQPLDLVSIRAWRRGVCSYAQSSITATRSQVRFRPCWHGT